MSLETIKSILSGTTDEKLEAIEKLTKNRLLVLLGVSPEVPAKMEYILTDVTLKRFNRISNEGMKSYEQEGLRITFPDSDFDEYKDEIQAFRDEMDKEKNPMTGVFRFL